MQRTTKELIEIDQIFNPETIKELRIRWKPGEGPSLLVKGRMELFLKYFRESWNIKDAALAARLSTARPHVWRNKYPEFKFAMEQMIPEKLADASGNLQRLMVDPDHKVASLSTFFYLNSSKEAKEAGWGQHNVIEHHVTLTTEENDALIDKIEKAGRTRPPKLLNKGENAIDGDFTEV